MSAALPGAIPWSKTKTGYSHGAFYAMTASIDHVVPHCAGGTNEETNLVTACWSCQFGKERHSLEELGLLDPRDRHPIKDGWDGLERLVRRPLTLGNVARKTPRLTTGSIPEVRDVPTPSPKKPRLTDAEWLAFLDGNLPSAARRLIAFVHGCSDLGVSWTQRDVAIVRMAVGGNVSRFIAIGRDGLVWIPWGVGEKKDAFKDFAETLATAIPGATAYETQKNWVVSKAAKRRLNLLEVLDAAPTLRLALETLRAALLAGREIATLGTQ